MLTPPYNAALTGGRKPLALNACGSFPGIFVEALYYQELLNLYYPSA